jgi:formate dehydrogenase subunit beta
MRVYGKGLSSCQGSPHAGLVAGRRQAVNNYWILETHGDPLGTVHKFVNSMWNNSGLDGMLVSENTLENGKEGMHLLEHPEQFEQVNPFKPLMTFNAAKYLPQALEEHPNAQLGAVLRPCEMRAITEMGKHTPINMDRLLSICIDCLGTYPADDVHWRTERKGSLEGLGHEALQFARQGGIVAYRYRSACQMCSAPNAKGGDINIFVIGLPVRQYILIHPRAELAVEKYKLDKITDGKADEELLGQRKKVIWKLAERHNRTRERVTNGLSNLIPANIDTLIAQLQQCGDCQECLNVCPICSVDFPRQETNGAYRRDDVLRWLVSCAGCGMCEQACVNHLPLSAIFGKIQKQIIDSLSHRQGYSAEDPLLLH